jgi:hypothetical protein
MNQTLPRDTSPTRPVIVVLGSGRSGTSLAMQVLAALGMRVSDELIEARRDNPQGFFEDVRIVRAHADLMRSLHAWPYHPLPPDWPDAPAPAVAGRELQGVLRDRLGQGNGPWGFKDPRTASFLPLWQRLFAEEGIAPRYILALRDPGSIVRSFMDAYATPAETAELVWLRRTCDALWHTRADCHIVHYEDWFSRSSELVEGLARFTNLRAGPGVAGSPRSLVRADLNRSSDSDCILRNPDARALHEALKTCRGDAFDRDRVLKIVAACQAGLDVNPARKSAHGSVKPLP